MGTVDESLWEHRCPKCGDTDPANQCPVSFENAICPQCHAAVFPRTAGKDTILFYHCQACGQRYLIPRLNPDDLLLGLMPP